MHWSNPIQSTNIQPMMIILGTWKKVDVKIYWKGYNNVDNLQELTIVNIL